MKNISERLLRITAFIFLAAILTTACTNEPVTPIPLPTADVPSLLEINGAINRWEGGNNLNYFVSVEETTNEGTFNYRMVISDGEVRVAQRLEKIEGKWQPPVAMSIEEAENYTIDSLLARILRDARGDGEAPLNMFTFFDTFTGAPKVVEAKAMPSYTEDGKLRLNRDFSYTLSVVVDVLLEETFGFGKNPLLTINRSGGENADCSTLRIFDDRTSIFSDNCRQILLQIIPPEEQFVQLEALANKLASTEDVRTESGGSGQVILNGTGNETINDTDLEVLWNLANELNELLSQPIGAGITLLSWNGEILLGYDMGANLQQPAALDFNAPFYGGTSNNNGTLFTFADSSGLKWVDLITGDTGTYGANPPGQHYRPLGLTVGTRILLQRVTEGSAEPDWGWISKEDRSWHPLPEEIICITDLSSNHQNEYVAVTTASTADCETDVDLWITNLITGESTPVRLEGEPGTAASWARDGKTLALSTSTTDDEGVVTSSLYTFDFAGQNITKLFDINGSMGATAWREDGMRLYYGLSDAGEIESGLYEYDLTTEEVTNSLIGNNLSPVSFDPSGEFLAFLEGSALRVWIIDFGRVVPITAEGLVDNPFVSWIDATNR